MSKPKQPFPNTKLKDSTFSLRNYLILATITFCLYANTLSHDYALDDIVVLTENKFVQQGFKGIPNILKHDYLFGQEQQQNELQGGRFRPFSLIIFAIEYQIFKLNPTISHLINVILYCCLICLLYLFLKNHLLSKSANLAFLTVLIFAIHPIHTEVVANVKSRDEILSFLFIVLSLLSFFKHQHSDLLSKKMVLSQIFFCISLLSRENGIVFIAIVPLLHFHENEQKTIIESLKKASPFLLTSIIYLIIRQIVLDPVSGKITEVLNAPYLYASTSQAFATKIFILFKQLSLLVWPFPLSYDYSYNHFGYLDINSLLFWFSMLFLTALLITGIIALKNKHLIGFAIIYYFITISLVSNFIIDIGATLTERSLFQASLAFSIVLGWAFDSLFLQKWWSSNSWLKTTIIIIFLAPYCYWTVLRNGDWKNNETLFAADMPKTINSAKSNCNYGGILIEKAKTLSNKAEKKSTYTTAIQALKRAIEIHPKYTDAYLNLGSAYFYLENNEKTVSNWRKALEISPYHPKVQTNLIGLSKMLMEKGNAQNQLKEYVKAIEFLKQSIAANPNNQDSYYYLGGNQLLTGDTLAAIQIWNECLELNAHAEALKWKNYLEQIMKKNISED